MLKPAILYKDELTKLFAEQLYTDNFFYYNGYQYANSIPEIRAEDDLFQYAIVDEISLMNRPAHEYIAGFLTYRIWTSTDTVQSFGLYSFDERNTTIGKDVYCMLRLLAKKHRRLEWRMIGGNPVQRTYDHFCEKFGGHKIVLHDVVLDNNGYYHDEHIYEIVNYGG